MAYGGTGRNAWHHVSRSLQSFLRMLISSPGQGELCDRRRAVALAFGIALVVPAPLMAVGCLVAPPPDLPAEPLRRPTILHDSVVPPADQVLTELPTGGFLVPVELEDPNEAYCFEVFVDYDPNYNQNPVRSPPCSTGSAAADGGVVLVS